MVADPDVSDAMARSFLGTLPPDLVDELLAEGERTGYPAGTTIYREGGALGGARHRGAGARRHDFR
jgi:CRP/FNR family transcriptional regulator, cyclic AMP receptor protein